MSEMLANQYFISGRYFEAFEEYLRLPQEKQNDVFIKEKMIISAALDENFEKALLLLKELAIGDFELFNGEKNIHEECSCRELMKKLETQNVDKTERSETLNMKIAILTYFSDRDKSLEYFKKIKNPNYANIINDFLKLFNYKKHIIN